MYSPQFAYSPPVRTIPPIPYAGGGRVAGQQKYGLASAAEELRRRGRGDDTILAHINPEEAGILKLLGGSGTINPYTGLPEYGLKLRYLNPLKAAEAIGSKVDDVIIQPVVSAAKDVGRSVDDFVNDAIPGGWVTVAAVAAATMGAPVPPGTESAAGSAGAASAMGTAGAAEALALESAVYGGSQVVPAAAGTAGIASGIPIVEGASSGVGITSIPPTVTPTSANVFEYGFPTVTQVPPAPVGLPTEILPGTSATAGSATPSTTAGISSLGGAAADTILGSAGSMAANAAKYAMADPIRTALGATTAYGMVKAAEETKAAREAAERELARQAAKRAEDIKLAEETLRKYSPRFRRLTAEDVRQYGIGMPQPPATVQVAKGGSISGFDDELGYDYRKGGISALPPRYLRGGGDGMSDSIPARIANKQEARLADGEFVIPADVVSHIGNGSSNAGAKKLYAMMDRIRRARTGKSKQAPAINTRRMMPA